MDEISKCKTKGEKENPEFRYGTRYSVLTKLPTMIQYEWLL